MDSKLKLFNGQNGSKITKLRYSRRSGSVSVGFVSESNQITVTMKLEDIQGRTTFQATICDTKSGITADDHVR